LYIRLDVIEVWCGVIVSIIDGSIKGKQSISSIGEEDVVTSIVVIVEREKCRNGRIGNDGKGVNIGVFVNFEEIGV
jgi:hypothetical protein